MSQWKCDDCGAEWKPRRNWTMKDPVRCKFCKSKAIRPKEEPKEKPQKT